MFAATWTCAWVSRVCCVRVACVLRVLGAQVVASGGTLTYQWSKGGVAISGATSATYSVAATAALSGSVYTCVVRNSAGPTTSSSATLTVVSLPTFTTQPARATKAVGATVTFSVVATAGNGVLTYVWKVCIHATSVCRVLEASCRTHCTGHRVMSLITLPPHLGPPPPTPPPPNRDPTLLLPQRNGVAIPGAPNAPSFQYTTVAADVGASISITVTATNLAGPATSTAAVLVVQTAPAITSPTAASTKTAVAKSKVALAVTATGSATLKYQVCISSALAVSALQVCFVRNALALQIVESGGVCVCDTV
jgi:hypothetical protein